MSDDGNEAGAEQRTYVVSRSRLRERLNKIEGRLRDREKMLLQARQKILSELSLLQREEVLIEEALGLNTSQIRRAHHDTLGE